MTVERPGTLALVEEPEARDIAKKPEGSLHTAFVRQVGKERCLCDDGFVDLDADERPGAGADEDGRRRAQGNGGDCGACVVRRDRHDRCICEPRVVRDLVSQRCESRSGLHDLRQ